MLHVQTAFLDGSGAEMVGTSPDDGGGTEPAQTSSAEV